MKQNIGLNNEHFVKLFLYLKLEAKSSLDRMKLE
ncbi:S-norcoclaurine synthase 1-like [Iris pallida]|uniref:S-norcoclaurine synthase 1-like n=1 Tax=Iris pallida TaxID=29817 RepID=A0AAX6EKN1_IRIPA|nr:S-norcoclaurine synthase 1-like [Iris pallida]